MQFGMNLLLWTDHLHDGLLPVLEQLKKIGYDGWVTIELYTCHENPDHAARTARERIMRIAEGVGISF